MATKPKQISKPNEVVGASAVAAAPPKSKKKLIIIILAVVILGLAGGGGWFYFTQMREKPASVKKVEPPVFVALDVFTVNLQGEDQQLLQTAITLQLENSEEATKLKENMPLIKNRLLLLLSSKTTEEIATAEGKNKLAQEIAEQVKAPLSPAGDALKVNNVLFTSFIIQ